jgi:hypothetical protein
MVTTYCFAAAVEALLDSPSLPTAKELAAATLPATARKRLRLTFEASEFSDIKLSFTARF